MTSTKDALIVARARLAEPGPDGIRLPLDVLERLLHAVEAPEPKPVKEASDLEKMLRRYGNILRGWELHPMGCGPAWRKLLAVRNEVEAAARKMANGKPETEKENRP